jgi:hypothetical protein
MFMVSSGCGRALGGLEEEKKGRRLVACGPLVVVLLSIWLKQSPQTTGSAKIKVPKKVQAAAEGKVCHND